MRYLNVYHNGETVGCLTEASNIWAFDYAQSWRDAPDGFDLSPALPREQKTIKDGGSSRPVQWYFDNLLPEEALREVVAREAGLRWEDAFGLLEYYGAESAGALVLLAPDAGDNLPAGRRELTSEQLSRRINGLPGSSLQKDAPKRMSLAGAQHKMLIIADGNRIYEPEAGTPSTHILKPNHPDDAYAASVINEYFVMRLARQMKLDVPDVMMCYVPEPVYFIERFDRTRDEDSKVKRTHIIDTCQLLNRDRAFKYSGADMTSLREAIAYCRNKAAARMSLFRWVVFNILVGNGDNHLKNVSFIVDREGIRVAPAYDLLATAVYETRALTAEKARWPASKLAMQLGGASTNFGDVTYNDMVTAGLALGLAKSTVSREIARQAETIEAVAAGVFDAVCAEHQSLIKSSPDETAAKKYWGIEERLLLAVRHIILHDMAKRLRV